jgi:uncharacterized phiE125 gp8 family phage protein
MFGIAPISIKRTSDSGTEPLSLDAAKEHLRVVDFADDDDYITGLITHARHTVEKATRRALWTGQTWQAGYQNFGGFSTVRGRLSVPKPPLAAVSSVQYYDDDNQLRTVSSSEYVVDDSGSDRAIIGFTSDFSLPTLSCDYAAPVRVIFTAGYADEEALPGGLLHAIKILLAHFYENRMPVGINVNLTEMPLSFRYLLNQYTVPNRV